MGRVRRSLSASLGIAALAGGLVGGAGILTHANPAGADTGDPVSITLGPDSTPDPMPVLFQGTVGDGSSSPLQHVEVDALKDVSGGSPQVIGSGTTDSSGAFALSANLDANGSYALRQKVPPGWAQAPYPTGNTLALNVGAIDISQTKPGVAFFAQQVGAGPVSVTSGASITATGDGAIGVEATTGSGLPATLSSDGAISADHPIVFGPATGSIGIDLAPVALTDTLANPAPIVTGGAPSLEAGRSASVNPATFTVGRYWSTSGPAPVATDFTASISWGDGTTSPGTVTGPDADGNFSVSSSHAYALAGSFTGSVTVTDGVTGDQTEADFTSAVASPVNPPTISKSFGSSSIPLGGQTSLTYAVVNPGPGIVSGLGFTDSLPSGLVVAAPSNGQGGSCGGTVTAVPGSSTVSWSGGSLQLQPLVSCTVSVNVIATSSGIKNNSVTVTSDQGTGNTALASVTVRGCPSGQKAYLFTGTTETPPTPALTIVGAFCVSKSGQATYQQGAATGSGGVNINGSSNSFIALGSNMNLGGGTSGPTSQFTEVQPIKATGTYTLAPTG